jgi:predicted DNA-binding protein
MTADDEQQEPRHAFIVRLPLRVWEQLREMADEAGDSKASVVRRAILDSYQAWRTARP